MASQLFSLGGYLAIAGWVALALSLFIAGTRLWTWRVTGIAIPAVLAVAYVFLLLTNASAGPNPDGGFGSIEAVRALFSDDTALAAGWIHYLAFDLFVGTWIVRAGLAGGVHPLLLFPCLPLTFLLGPAGLLLAFIVLMSFGNHTWLPQR